MMSSHFFHTIFCPCFQIVLRLLHSQRIELEHLIVSKNHKMDSSGGGSDKYKKGVLEMVPLPGTQRRRWTFRLVLTSMMTFARLLNR